MNFFLRTAVYLYASTTTVFLIQRIAEFFMPNDADIWYMFIVIGVSITPVFAIYDYWKGKEKRRLDL